MRGFCGVPIRIFAPIEARFSVSANLSVTLLEFSLLPSWRSGIADGSGDELLQVIITNDGRTLTADGRTDRANEMHRRRRERPKSDTCSPNASRFSAGQRRIFRYLLVSPQRQHYSSSCDDEAD